ncbi:MFS transporter [Spirosoma radiotolerans]|uniref:MFS transporter n=1 Tax=Spirosoma radiotolerans TaxID=1379870 RepID=A0A0E3VAM0_9BACT|nr:MFS transporter [Spirosoma radiotolerans]
MTTLPPTTYPLTLSRSRLLRYFVFFYLYVMQGIPAGFSLTALTNYLAAEGIKPKVIGSFAAIAGLPWAFQFIWGPLIDRYQNSAMGRRKPWVIGTQCLAGLASLGLLFVQDPAKHVITLAWFFFTHSVFAAIQDASVDAMAISVIPEDERGRVNAFMRAGFLIGTGVGAAVFSQLLRTYGFFNAALVQSLLLLALTALTFFIRERPDDQLLPSVKRQPLAPRSVSTDGPLERPEHDFRWLFTELFKGLFARRSLLLFGSVVAAYVSISLFMRGYNYHLIHTLGWTDTSVSGLTGTYGMLVATAVALAGGYVADRISPRLLLVIVLAMVAVYLLVFNSLSAQWVQREVAQTGLVALYFMDPSISIAAMPVLMAICRPGVEGSQFTTYMAFINLCDIAGSYLAGHAQEYVSVPTIGLFAGGLAVVAMLTALFTIRHYRTVDQAHDSVATH